MREYEVAARERYRHAGGRVGALLSRSRGGEIGAPPSPLHCSRRCRSLPAVSIARRSRMEMSVERRLLEPLLVRSRCSPCCCLPEPLLIEGSCRCLACCSPAAVAPLAAARVMGIHCPPAPADCAARQCA
ncbi:hypothetical protein Dimus_018999 [Dionaea muscipula]